MYSATPNPKDWVLRYYCYSLANLFNQNTISAITPWTLFVHKYTPMSIARYSFIQMSELEQCRGKRTAQSLTLQPRSSSLDLLVESKVLATALLKLRNKLVVAIITNTVLWTSINSYWLHNMFNHQAVARFSGKPNITGQHCPLEGIKLITQLVDCFPCGHWSRHLITLNNEICIFLTHHQLVGARPMI